MKFFQIARSLKYRNADMKIVLSLGLSQCLSHSLSSKVTPIMLHETGFPITLHKDGRCGATIEVDWKNIFYPNGTILQGRYTNYDQKYALDQLEIFMRNILMFIERLNLDGINIFPPLLMLEERNIYSSYRKSNPSKLFSITTHLPIFVDSHSDLINFACGTFDWIIIDSMLLGEDFNIQNGIIIPKMKFLNVKNEIAKRCSNRTRILDSLNLYGIVAEYRSDKITHFNITSPSEAVTKSEIIAFFEVTLISH